MDLNELSKAPWVYKRRSDYWSITEDIQGKDNGEGNEADYELVALARNALDVMMRRGWGVGRLLMKDGSYKWAILNDGGRDWAGSMTTRISLSDEPFTALVKADAWYRENVEKE